MTSGHRNIVLNLRRPYSSPRRPHPRSLWLDQALARESIDTASPGIGRDRVDICVLGGGFTGLWTAIRLREMDPGIRVALIEANICGAGASGRNGGFVSNWWPKLGTFLQFMSTSEAMRLVRASEAAVDGIGEYCEAHRIDCQFAKGGVYWAATSEVQRGAWNDVVAQAAALNETPFREAPHAELVHRIGSAQHLEGVYTANAATVHPGMLVRGLRARAIELGVRIFENTAVDRVSTISDGVKIETASGEMHAAKAVLAMNSWMASLPQFQRGMFVVSSDVVATAPIPTELSKLGWEHGVGVWNSRMMINYYRTTADRRIVLGRGGGTLAYGGRFGSKFEVSQNNAQDVAGDLHDLFPSLGDVAITHRWAGPIERSVSGIPTFGLVDNDPRLLFAIGYAGNGVGPSSVAGRMLASAALERDDEWAEMQRTMARNDFAGLPPEPIRYIGGRIVKAAVARKERLENANRKVPSLLLRVAGMAPATTADVLSPTTKG